MIPTPEMIEAMKKALVRYSPIMPIDEALSDALTAALALLPGEPVGYMRPKDNDGNSFWCAKSPGAYYSQPLYASPAPLPVAVKAKKLPAIGEELYEHYSVMSAQTHEALVKEYARKAIRSALSSPVGGVEESNDFEHWAETRHRTVETMCTLLGINGNGSPDEILDQLQAKLSSPTPASDIAALREENERLKKALEKIADMIDSEDADLDDAILIASAWRKS